MGIRKYYSRWLLLLILSSFALKPNNTLAQTIPEIIDSLTLRLANEQNDTTIIKLCNRISTYYNNIDNGQGIYYAKMAYKKADSINYTRGKIFGLGNQGDAYFEMSQLDKAENLYATAYQLADSAQYLKEMGIFKMLIGNVYSQRRQFILAEEAYKESIASFNELGSFTHIAKVHNNLSINYMNQGKLSEALDYRFKALRAIQSDTAAFGVDYENLLIIVYSNIAVLYNSLEEYDKAIEYGQKSVQRNKNLQNHQELQRAYHLLGQSHGLKGDFDKSLEYFDKSLELNREMGLDVNQAIVYFKMGETFLLQEHYETALEYYDKSLAIAQQYGIQQGILSNYVGMGKAYTGTRQFYKAEEYFHKAQELLNPQQVSDYIDVLEAFYLLYREALDYEKALDYFEQYKQLEDSLEAQDSESELQQLKVLYETEQKEHELQLTEAEVARKNAEIKRQNIQKWWFISGLASMVIILIITYIFFQKNKRKNALLTRKNTEIEQQKEEIVAQAEKLKATNDRLIKLDQFKQNMSSMIVHDLKNPLNAIINLSNYSNTPNEDIKQYGWQMLNMVNNILDIHKFEETKMALNLLPLNIVPILENAVRQTHFLQQRKSITITQKIAKNTAVLCDETIIQRVFINLLTNAIKYTPENGHITLWAEQAGKKTIFYVKDTGAGIPAEQLDTVFEQFTQIEARQSGKVFSTGLGLTFCKLAVEAHNGQVGVESPPEQGATFWFSLPTEATNTLAHDTSLLPKTIKTPVANYLSENSQQQLQPYIKQLQQHEIYEITRLREIIKNITQLSDKQEIEQWGEQLTKAVKSGNELLFAQLVHPYSNKNHDDEA